MDDIDEGIGSNDSIEGNPAFTKSIDHLRALNQLKRLNGESVTTGKLSPHENDEKDDFESSAVLLNAELSAKTLANSPEDACEKVNVFLKNGEHEKCPPSGNINPQIDGKNETSDTKSSCKESLQKDEIANSKSTNGCYLNVTNKCVDNEMETNNKLRILIANAKNSLKIPKPDKRIDLDEEESLKSDTEEVSRLDIPESDAEIVSEASKPVTETVLADPPVLEKMRVHTEAFNDADTIQIDEEEVKQETHDKKENGINQSDDEDDDVIFEGESKVASNAKSPSHPDSTILPTTDESLTDTAEEVETESGAKEDAHHTVELESKAESEGFTKDVVEKQNNSPKKDKGNLNETKADIILDEEDDDVIFEGETKADTQLKHEKPSIKSSNDTTTAVNEHEQNESKTDSLKSEKQETLPECQTATNSEDDDVIFEKETKIDVSVKDIEKGLQEEDDKIPVDKLQSEDQTKANCDIKDNNGDIDSKLPVCPESKSANGERKRPAESNIDSESKRSKLEPSPPFIDVNEPTSIDLIDTDEEDMDTSEPVTNGVPNHKGNKNKGHIKEETKKMITLSEQELDTLVRSKVKAFLAAQRDTLLAQMSQKLQCFQTNNDIWKRQVKDLQGKVNEATVLQQKHEKRKAHTAALRQITTRNVAVQVDDGRTSNAKTKQPSGVAAGSPNKPAPKSVQNVMSPVVTAPPGANGMIRLPIPQSSIAPSMLPNTGQKVSPNYKMPTVKSLLDTTRTQPTISSVTQNNGTSTQHIFNVQYPQRTVNHVSTATTSFISLSPTQVPASTVVKQVSQPGKSKIIDLTDDEPRMLASLPQAITTVNTSTGMRTLVREGSQFVRATFPNTPGSFQLVFPPGTQPIRPGTMITGLPPTLIPTSFVNNPPPLNPPPVVATTTTTTVNRPTPQLQNPALVQTVTVKPPQPIPPLEGDADETGKSEAAEPHKVETSEPSISRTTKAPLFETSGPSSSEITGTSLSKTTATPIYTYARKIPGDVNNTPEHNYSLLATSENENTAQNTGPCSRKFQKWMTQAPRNDLRDIWTIMPPVLDEMIELFLLSIRKGDGSEYGPVTLTAFHTGIDRILSQQKYPYNILWDKEFSKSRHALAAKKKELISKGKQNQLTIKDMEKLQILGIIGTDTPKRLLNLIWFNNTVLFGLHGGYEHSQLLWGDIALKRNDSGQEYLEYNERITKTKAGKKTARSLAFSPKQFAQETRQTCPVYAYKEFASHRFIDMCQPNYPFYLAVCNVRLPLSCIWYESKPLGVKSLNNLERNLVNDAYLNGKKANDSARIQHEYIGTFCVGVSPPQKQQLSADSNDQSVHNCAEASNIMQGNKSDFRSNNPNTS